MRNAGEEQVSATDLAVFYGIPASVTMVIALDDFHFRRLDALLAGLSILVGLLFNLLVLMFDVAMKLDRTEAVAGTTQRVILIKETQANATYAVMVGLASVVAVAVSSLSDTTCLPLWASCALGYLLSHFVLTLLMVIKRIRATFYAQFD